MLSFSLKRGLLALFDSDRLASVAARREGVTSRSVISESNPRNEPNSCFNPVPLGGLDVDWGRDVKRVIFKLDISCVVQKERPPPPS